MSSLRLDNEVRFAENNYENCVCDDNDLKLYCFVSLIISRILYTIIFSP